MVFPPNVDLTAALPAQPTSAILITHRLAAHTPMDANGIILYINKSSTCEALITDQPGRIFY